MITDPESQNMFWEIVQNDMFVYLCVQTTTVAFLNQVCSYLVHKLCVAVAQNVMLV